MLLRSNYISKSNNKKSNNKRKKKNRCSFKTNQGWKKRKQKIEAETNSKNEIKKRKKLWHDSRSKERDSGEYEVKNDVVDYVGSSDSDDVDSDML